jgi:hypothetical protein
MAGAVAFLGGAIFLWRRHRARRRQDAATRQGKLHSHAIHEAPGSSDAGVPSSTVELGEMWAPPTIHELPTSRMESPTPPLAHHRDFSFATVGTQQHQRDRDLEDEEERERELQEQYRQYHQHLSPDVSPETQAVSPIDRSSTTRSGGSQDNAHMHGPPG